MVLKFEEYLKEGLWSKGLERAQTGEERLGDRNPETAVNNVIDFIKKIIEEKFNITPKIVHHFDTVEPTRNNITLFLGRIGSFNTYFDVDNDEINNKNKYAKYISDETLRGSEDTIYSKKLRDILLFISEELKKEYNIVNEGLWSKGLERAQTGEERIEDNDLTPSERELYTLLKEWCKGGQLNITKGKFEPRHSFDKNWDEFQKNLFDQLSKIDCCKLLIDNPHYSQSKLKIINTINNGHGVIFSPSFQYKIEDEIYMVAMDETIDRFAYYTLSTHYYSETNVDIMMDDNLKPRIPTINDTRGIYIAYKVPEKVLLKVMKQNKIT